MAGPARTASMAPAAKVAISVLMSPCLPSCAGLQRPEGLQADGRGSCLHGGGLSSAPLPTLPACLLDLPAPCCWEGSDGLERVWTLPAAELPTIQASVWRKGVTALSPETPFWTDSR